MNGRHSALIRCDASAKIGHGHLMRCLALADQMRNSGHWTVTFAIADDETGAALARASGFAAEHRPTIASATSEVDWIEQLVQKHRIDVLVMDIRTGLTQDDVYKLRQTGVTVACIDDASDRRLACDFAFYPPVPQVSRLDWQGFQGRCIVGWEWILMPAQFEQQARQAHGNQRARLKLLVTMGGSDPAALTLLAIEALDNLEHDIDVDVVLGSAFLHEAVLADRLAKAKRKFTLLRSPASMATVMASADLALASFGATAYELACVGVPALHLCLTADHEMSASALHGAGVSCNLGEYTTVSPADICASLESLMINPEQRKQMRDAGRSLIDGRGAARVMAALENKLEANHAV